MLSHILLSPWAPFMPPAKSDFAGSLDTLYGFIWWTMAFFFVIIVFLLFYLPYKYRRGDKPTLTPRITHNLALELTWSGIPALLIIVIAFWGFNLFVKAYVPPGGDVTEINVTGKQWAWSFEHKDGTVIPGELHVPVGRPVKLVMSSTDVIHSFFIPDFRVKSDVVPGRYSSIWFTPKEVGDHQVFCTEYCGDSHSAMLATVHVVTEEQYKETLENGGLPKEAPPAQRGALIYQRAGCVTCHTVDGVRLVGPTFKGIFGRTEQLVGGGSLTVDENYIRESILQPQAKIVAGFEGQQMPSFQGVLNDRQIGWIIEYLKTLK
ncbi:MAG TPA: cytochrome c oxidase subunit II [Blastocatellia bacterium]|nr:cytochrome c oxidase subunit II [Blastocatellia bacterium]